MYFEVDLDGPWQFSVNSLIDCSAAVYVFILGVKRVRRDDLDASMLLRCLFAVIVVIKLLFVAFANVFFSFNLNIVWYFVAVGKLLVFVVTPTNPLTLSRTRECVFDPCTWRSISMDENYFMLFGNLSDLLLCYFSLVHGVPATYVPTLHIRKQTINQNAYQYTRVQDRNTGMALTAYLMSRLLFLLHAFISFHFLSCLCVCYYICLYFGKAAFHGCPIKCLSLSLSLWILAI